MRPVDSVPSFAGKAAATPDVASEATNTEERTHDLRSSSRRVLKSGKLGFRSKSADVAAFFRKLREPRKPGDAVAGVAGLSATARRPAAYRAADLLKPAGAPDAVLEVGPGRWQTTAMTVKQLLERIERHFARLEEVDRTPGELTELLRQLRPDDVVSPEIVCSVVSSKSITGQDAMTSRSLAEAAMVAQWRTSFMWSHDITVRTNVDRKLLPKEPDREQRLVMARGEARFCLATGLVPKDGSVLVFGAGAGEFSQALEEEGVHDVVSIEPGIEAIVAETRNAAGRAGGALTADEERRFAEIVPMTGEQFHEKYPDRMFSVVIASNFHPYIEPGMNSSQAMAATLESMALMTKSDGKTVVGVSSTDPHMVAMVENGGVGASAFDDVTAVMCRESQQFTDYRAVNGQVCFLDFRQPKGAPLSKDE